MNWKLTLLTVTAAATLCAQPMRTPPVDDVKAYLGLSDSQVTNLQTLRTQEMTETQALHEQIRTKQQAFKTLIDSGTTNAAQVGAAFLEIQTLQKQVGTIHTTYRTRATAVLTDAQKTKLKTLEEAVALREEIAQATMLNLMTPPEGGFGAGGPGVRMPGPGGPGMMGFPSGPGGPGAGPMMLRRKQ